MDQENETLEKKIDTLEAQLKAQILENQEMKEKMIELLEN